jgi:Mg-chelatase subunit ChlD
MKIKRIELRKTVFLVFLICVKYSFVVAQPANVKFSTEIVDFGKIASVQYPAKTVEFTNLSGENLAILVVEKSADVKAGYEHKFIEPGGKGLISLFYEAGKIGPFSEQIKIFTNLDNEPYILTLRGICVSIEECFPDKSNLNLRNITVVNKITQQPIGNAQVSFIHNFKESNPIICKTDKTGHAVKELPIGQYNAKSEVSGYKLYNQDFYLPRSQPNILIELIPQQTVSVAQIPEEPATKPYSTATGEKEIPKITSVELPEDKYAANNIVLLLDVSSSMRNNGKFSLLQQSVNNLILILRPIDNVSLITYAGNATVVLEGISGNEKEKIMEVVQNLNAYGITQGVKGLNTAYDLASKKYIANGNNQIILATDGEFSEKNVTDEYYQNFISGYSAKGIKLSILGFGVNEEAIGRMKKMTSSGNGSYIHVGSEKYVKDVLINDVKTMSFMDE